VPQDVVTSFRVIEQKSKGTSERKRITEPNILPGGSDSFQ
jgi:hypothetical protein